MVFSVDIPVNRRQILVGLDVAGIDVDKILSIQRRTSNNSWCVSFRSPEAKNMALGITSVQIAGCTVFLGDCENRVQIVKIYKAPTELPDTALIGRLSHYGKVFSFRCDKVASNIYNGVRMVRICLNLPIPPTILIAGEPIRIWYPMPKMCRHCGDASHVAAKCSSVRCFKCEAHSHRADECTIPTLCSICLREGHNVIASPFYLYSANVVTEPAESLAGSGVEFISQPAKSPSYA